MRKILLCLLFQIISCALFAQDNNILSDTTLAVKIARKALKLMDSKKEKDIAKGVEMYKEAAEMGLMSAQRNIMTYYLQLSPPDVSNGLYWARKLAEAGDADSQYLLGYLYLGLDSISDIQVMPNDILGARYMRMAAEQGHIDAEFFYANCLEFGKGTIRNEKLAFDFYLRSADHGNAVAQFRIGVAFAFEDKQKKDYKKGFFYTEKSALQGYGLAQYNLGLMYHLAEGIEKNLDEAIYWYTKAIEHNVDAARNNLALAMEEKNGNSDETLFLLRKGADSGDEIAQYNLANRYAQGDGVTQSMEMAMNWYQKSAEKGYAPSQRILGIEMLSDDGVIQDKEQGFNWLVKSAEQNDTIALRAIGYCYQNGNGIEVNPDKAFLYYSKAMDMGDSRSIYNIAVCYYNGIGVSQSKEIAIEYLKKAVKLDVVDAIETLASCYQYGDGISTDYAMAVSLYERAIGMKSANKADDLFLLSLCYDKMNNEKKRIECLLLSSDEGHPRAKYNLALSYYNGQGVSRDLKKAKSLLHDITKCSEDKEVADKAAELLKVINQ